MRRFIQKEKEVDQEFDLVDKKLVQLSNAVPIGTMLLWSGGAVPTGFLLCDGTLQLIDKFRALFSVLEFRGDSFASPPTPLPTDNISFRLPSITLGNYRFIIKAR